MSLTVRLRVQRGFSIDVDFEAPPGVTALFGPSGAGKSTTLAAIAGLLRPADGRIALDDDVWFDAASGAFRPVHQRKVAYVFQSLALFPHMSARENVEYGIDRGVPRPERAERARGMLARMRVGHLAERRPRTFSGGEAQRVALARAFAMEPKIVLLDEAFSAMDRELRRELTQDVRKYIEDVRIPAILVTHHRNEARAMADRVVLLDAGRVRAVGGVDELLPRIPEDA
jgi:molybdate transport system ATP-binding protein